MALNERERGRLEVIYGITTAYAFGSPVFAFFVVLDPFDNATATESLVIGLISLAVGVAATWFRQRIKKTLSEGTEE